MKAFLCIMWVVFCALVVYLIGAFAMLRWDYLPLIDAGSRGAMAVSTLMSGLGFQVIPLCIYEHFFE